MASISKPAELCNLPSGSWVCPQAFSQLNMPETLHLGDVQEASYSDTSSASMGFFWC